MVSTESHTQKEEVDAFDEFDPRGSTAGRGKCELFQAYFLLTLCFNNSLSLL